MKLYLKNELTHHKRWRTYPLEIRYDVNGMKILVDLLPLTTGPVCGLKKAFAGLC